MTWQSAFIDHIELLKGSSLILQRSGSFLHQKTGSFLVVGQGWHKPGLDTCTCAAHCEAPRSGPVQVQVYGAVDLDTAAYLI